MDLLEIEGRTVVNELYLMELLLIELDEDVLSLQIRVYHFVVPKQLESSADLNYQFLQNGRLPGHQLVQWFGVDLNEGKGTL